MKVYLSHGGGINSWALYLYLIEQGQVPEEDFEAVFVNHGTDWPETYEYMDMMLAKGYPVTWIKPNVLGHSVLYDFCRKKEIIPNRNRRWCTVQFKSEPLDAYCQKPAIQLVGIDAGESQRAKVFERNGITFDYPLVAAGIDRQGCIDLIKRHGLPVPLKSGCWICPFQKREQWIELKRRHPDLFCKAVQLENLCNERRKAAGKKPVYFRDMPLEVLVQPKDNAGRRAIPGQEVLFDADYDRPPCRCGL
jgi:hypothetical protein